ncbi:MAG TPA: hypothetical protein VGO93_04765, partial [Candidatus Xenobia bacterium]
ILLAMGLVGSAQAVDLTHESLAGLHFGDPAALVKRHLGKPLRESKPIMGQATGEMESTLEYPHLEIGLGNGKVRFLLASSPSTYATSKHVHVGDKSSQAKASYGKLDQMDEKNYIELSMTEEKGRIVKIYLGAGPE